GNTASAPPPPVAAPMPATGRSSRFRSWILLWRHIGGDRAHLDATEFALARQMLAGFDRIVQRRAVDDPETEQLFLGFSERAVDHDRIVTRLDEGGGRGRHQTQAWPERALLLDPGLGAANAFHHRLVVLAGEAAHGGFVVVAKQGIEHRTS